MTILRGFTPTLSVNAIHQVSLDLLFPQAVRIPFGIMRVVNSLSARAALWKITLKMQEYGND